MSFKPPHVTEETKPLYLFSEWVDKVTAARLNRLHYMIRRSQQVEQAWENSIIDDYDYSIYRDLEYADFIMGIFAMREGILLNLCDEIFKDMEEECRKEYAKAAEGMSEEWIAENRLQERIENSYFKYVSKERCEEYKKKREGKKKKEKNGRIRDTWTPRDSLFQLANLDGEKISFDKEHDKEDSTGKSRTEKIMDAQQVRNDIVHNAGSLPDGVEFAEYCENILRLIHEELTQVINEVNAKIIKIRGTSQR